MTLDYWPPYEDGTSSLEIPLYAEDVDTVMEQIKGCSSVAELCDLLCHAVDAKEYYEANEKPDLPFQQAMAQYQTLEELESVTVHEYFTGWGEFARDSVDDFLNAAEDGEVLQDKLTEFGMSLIAEHFENDNICRVDAYIHTTLTLSNGTIQTTYDLDGDWD